ncbi:preprotein translocase subunit SecG [Candidatus Peregrinibacteria bacterium CG_4_10_14_0_2_um_filter_43_11]|nr:MAG: preprotein translocase subunit SecG [Candidatus Peregrinibacteria bacterium CG_4_10_14_0_2_um_filter_43_11]
MQHILLVTHVVISILLSIFILIQNKDGGMSAIMGGSGQGFQSTKRGAEKVIFNATILFAALFILNALAFVLV